ncbi:hypothetical protein INS49_007091 [Diaporthe citri]|uniref:uncharacterized protein n=1 Tax=Diaporthe citri TaxID=83186 RepID=UPI001C8039B1|nr:uncharacterized protein INS49_007091 [Diaporthe citri]KAG6365480.1 hypothetical protein INS49_007091 [Diaporthe citri]
MGLELSALPNQKHRLGFIWKITNLLKQAATALPIVFAAVFGRLTTQVSRWRLEKGASLPSIEQWLGSRTVFSAFLTQIHLGGLNTVGVLMTMIWSLSPLGAQSILRAFGTALKDTQTHGPVVYFDTNTPPFFFESTFWGQSGNFDLTRSMYTAAMLSADETKASSQDSWGNVKIPYMSSYENTHPDDSWVQVPDNDNLVFSSQAFESIAGGISPGHIGNLTTLASIHTYEEVYTINTPWITVFFVTALVMFAGSIAGAVFCHVSRTPDILGYASSAIRDSKYVNLAPGFGGLAGLEMTKAFEGIEFRYGVVERMKSGQEVLGVSWKLPTNLLRGAFEEITQKDLEDVFKTNFHGPLNITRAILPKLRAKGTGTLLFMSSQAGWHADPSATGYCSTKFALEGAVECLAKELAIFAPGLKVLLVEPGYFRTRAFSNISHVEPRVDIYSQFNAGVQAVEQSIVGNEPGDSAKAVTRMIELTNGTGMAAGKTVPLRVPLGSDGWTRIKDKCEETLKICEEWEDVAKSTDVQQ